MTDEQYLHRIMSLRQQLLEDGFQADHQSEEDLAEMLRQDIARVVVEMGRRCTFSPGTWDKRFIRSMVAIVAEGKTFTPRQMVMVYRLRHKYRRQFPITAGELVLSE